MQRYPRDLMIETNWPVGAIRQQREQRAWAARELGVLLVPEIAHGAWRIELEETATDMPPHTHYCLIAHLAPIG